MRNFAKAFLGSALSLALILGAPALHAQDNSSDAALTQKLVKKIAYDRSGHRSAAFNDIKVSVQNGVVTLSGSAYSPIDKNSALAAARSTKGVKNAVDNITVQPTSFNDDRLRADVARAIYGFPSLQRYAADPAKQIRIIVVHGNVTLEGVVDNKTDSDTANIRANSVAGVFKVTNNLRVAGSSRER